MVTIFLPLTSFVLGAKCPTEQNTYLARYYAVEGKIERSWSFLTDNINSIRETPSQTKHTIKMFVHSRKSQPDTLYGHVTIQGRLEGVTITRHSPLNVRDLHFLWPWPQCFPKLYSSKHAALCDKRTPYYLFMSPFQVQHVKSWITKDAATTFRHIHIFCSSIGHIYWVTQHSVSTSSHLETSLCTTGSHTKRERQVTKYESAYGRTTAFFRLLPDHEHTISIWLQWPSVGCNVCTK